MPPPPLGADPLLSLLHPLPPCLWSRPIEYDPSFHTPNLLAPCTIIGIKEQINPSSTTPYCSSHSVVPLFTTPRVHYQDQGRDINNRRTDGPPDSSYNSPWVSTFDPFSSYIAFHTLSPASRPSAPPYILSPLSGLETSSLHPAISLNTLDRPSRV